MCIGTQELISMHAVKNYSSKDIMTYVVNESCTAPLCSQTDGTVHAFSTYVNRNKQWFDSQTT